MDRKRKIVNIPGCILVVLRKKHGKARSLSFCLEAFHHTKNSDLSLPPPRFFLDLSWMWPRKVTIMVLLFSSIQKSDPLPPCVARNVVKNVFISEILVFSAKEGYRRISVEVTPHFKYWLHHYLSIVWVPEITPSVSGSEFRISNGKVNFKRYWRRCWSCLNVWCLMRDIWYLIVPYSGQDKKTEEETKCCRFSTAGDNHCRWHRLSGPEREGTSKRPRRYPGNDRRRNWARFHNAITAR